LKITDVRIRLIKDERSGENADRPSSKLKAVASITIDDCFVVHDIKVIEGSQGFFISNPSRKTPQGEYKDIVHAINNETREMIKAAILAEYEKAEKQE